jgi:hypothetical protein
MTKRVTAIALAAAFLAAIPYLSGCYESTDFTWYEAGVYKGERDPLLAELKKPELQQRLEERFRRVQTDR